MKQSLHRFILALALVCLSPIALAQTFPAGPVTLVVPLAPGDAADTSSRLMAEEMAKHLNAPVVVTNRPGAGGAIAAAAVAGAKKDGQTILFAQNSALTFRVALDPPVSYETLRDFTPLGRSSQTPTVIVVRADAPYKTFAEFIEFAKKNPGQARIGHPGVGSVGDFCIRLINSLTGANLLGVPYVGAAPGITALRGGQIEGVALALGALSPQIRAGAFRGIATSSRAPEFADIPTLRELGYPEDLFGVWFSFLAPAGIPEATRKTLVEAIEQAVNAPAVSSRLAPLGIVQSYAPPDAMTSEIREESRRVADIVKKTSAPK